MGDALAARTFLIHDRDALVAGSFDAVFRSESLRVVKTPVRAPMANAVCERWIGTLRRECLDWILIIRGRQLQAVLHEYIRHYNTHRPTVPWGSMRPRARRPRSLLHGHHSRKSSAGTGSAGCSTSTSLQCDGRIVAPHRVTTNTGPDQASPWIPSRPSSRPAVRLVASLVWTPTSCPVA
jgi:hypothetical protein